jgi:hypothetical protein
MSQQHNRSPEKPPEERTANPVVIGQIATGAMALGLVLPWLGGFLESRSYLNLVLSLLEQLAGAEHPLQSLATGGPHQSGPWWASAMLCINMIGAFVLPGVATCVAVGASLGALGGKGTDPKAALKRYFSAGWVGLVGSAAFFWLFKLVSPAREMIGELGTGFFIFVFASVALLVVGKLGHKGP